MKQPSIVESDRLASSRSVPSSRTPKLAAGWIAVALPIGLGAWGMWSALSSPYSIPFPSNGSGTTAIDVPSVSTTPTSVVSAVKATAMGAPVVPADSAYLGAWVNPAHLQADRGQPGSVEVQQLGAFNTNIGKAVSILHVYTPFRTPLPTAALNTVAHNGSIPLLDWGCTDVSQISSGADDGLIAAYAKALKTYAKPVFLRWYWEMNIHAKSSRACGGYGNGSAYVDAWRHIWSIFQATRALNVAFVWSPSSQTDATSYYPGDRYVDWIAADGYDVHHHGDTAFATLFGDFYNTWSGHNKPLMIGETGATPIDQVQYLQTLQTELPTKYPDVKALVYFDAPGPRGQWQLDTAGLAAFKSLADTPYFSVVK